MVIYLDYTEAIRSGALTNRETYLQKYNKEGSAVRLVGNVEPIVNVEGHYVLLSKLADLAPFTFRSILRKYVNGILTVDDKKVKDIVLKWRR